MRESLATPAGLDPDIEPVVALLREAGFVTHESCEGGEGHAFAKPTVSFSGSYADGLAALALALQHPETGLMVRELRRMWRMEDGELSGPWWDLEFRRASR